MVYDGHLDFLKKFPIEDSFFSMENNFHNSHHIVLIPFDMDTPTRIMELHFHNTILYEFYHFNYTLCEKTILEYCPRVSHMVFGRIRNFVPVKLIENLPCGQRPAVL